MKEKIKLIFPSPIKNHIKFILKISRKIKTNIKQKKKRKTPTNTTYLGSNSSVLQCCIAYNKFGGYCIPLSSYHRVTAQKILYGEIHERETVEYIMNHCQGGDIVHAGAYFGDSLPAFSQACIPHKVWAFEPNPENYRCASITMLINNLKNVELVNGGLGAKQDNLELIIENSERIPLGGGSYIGKSNKNSQKSILVPIYTLDNFIPKDRKISILHLDVEGYEVLALEGAMFHIKKSKPILILETFPEQEWLTNNLFPLGYKYVGGVCRNRSDLLNHIFSIY
jgi:FkbM family methyltransferase